MNAKVLSVAVLALFLAAVAGGNLSAASFTEPNTYDFSQSANPTWDNYCAPTVAADVVYHLGLTYASLVQNNSYGPGNQPAANNGATDIIGGQAPPNGTNGADPPNGGGPLAGSLAQRMGTTRNDGTTLDNLALGLNAYLTANSNVAWNTQELLAANYVVPQGDNGQSFLTALQNNLSGGADVILAIAWQNGLPGDPYQVPNNYGESDDPSKALGHAVQMIGYDTDAGTISLNNPADNAAHNWGAENASYNVIGLPASLQITLGGKTATIYGAVVTQAVPEPSTLLMLLVGAASLTTVGLVRFTRARRQAA